MSNKDNAKKKFFWTFGGVVCVFLACLIVFVQREETPQEETPAKATDGLVWVDIEDVLPEGAVYPSEIARITAPAGVNPRDYVLSKLEQNRKKEPEEEVDPAEAERLANWKANFPYKPTTDPDVVITQETMEDKDPTVEYNHMFL